jgi:hypothetical protein
MSKGTPGPWFATTRRGSWDWLVASEADPNIEVCQMFHDATEENEIGEANAHLVAAAPDLLAALKGVVAIADRKTDEFDRARAAIAKAEGRS